METVMTMKDTTAIIEKFVEASMKHEEATNEGDYKTANKSYKIIMKMVDFLKDHQEINKLSELLNHSSVGVRLWTATILLPVSELESLKVLNQISKGNGIHSFEALTIIKEWENGNLKS